MSRQIQAARPARRTDTAFSLSRTAWVLCVPTTIEPARRSRRWRVAGSPSLREMLPSWRWRVLYWRVRSHQEPVAARRAAHRCGGAGRLRAGLAVAAGARGAGPAGRLGPGRRRGERDRRAWLHDAGLAGAAGRPRLAAAAARGDPG